MLNDKEKNTVNKLSLKVKLGLGFGGVLLILAIMGTAACNGVGQLSDISDRVVKAMTQKDLASQVHASIEMQSTGVRGFLLSGRDDTLQHDDAGKKQLAESMETLRQTIVTDEGRRLQDEVQQNYAEWRPIADSAIALRRAGKIKQAENALFTPHANETRTKMRRGRKFREAGRKVTGKSGKRAANGGVTRALDRADAWPCRCDAGLRHIGVRGACDFLQHCPHADFDSRDCGQQSDGGCHGDPLRRQ